jgi:hypothetical protein
MKVISDLKFEISKMGDRATSSEFREGVVFQGGACDGCSADWWEEVGAEAGE